MITQPEMMARLAAVYEETKSLSAVLMDLENWSRAAGYFNHLTQPNEYLTFEDDQLDVTLRLQINYSRLAYTKPKLEREISCHLCYENIGSPGKELLRAFEFTAAGCEYFAHLTPFPLHDGHFVMNSRVHEPMRISGPAIRETADFVHRAPGWLAASNSDVEWAGASILGHHHCQIFRDLALPLESAQELSRREFADYSASMLHWPGPVMRLSGVTNSVILAAISAIARWKALDQGANTVNFLARTGLEGELTIHLIFRNPGHRTVPPVTEIKREGVGVIEVSGEIIVPPIGDKSREANLEYFSAKGLQLCRSIISMNSPNGVDVDWLGLVG